MSSSKYLKLPSFNWKTAIHKTDGEIICELRSQTEQRAERIKELEAQFQQTHEWLCDRNRQIDEQSAALKLAKDALTDWLTTDLDEQQCWQALAAIDRLEANNG